MAEYVGAKRNIVRHQSAFSKTVLSADNEGSLAFADEVIISEADFVKHDRYTIEVRVPEEAKTGKIELYTADLTVSSDEELDYQIISSDKAIEIGTPSVTSITGRNTAEALGNITAKAGEEIKIAGTYFNMVADVTIGGVSATDMKIANDGTGIVFTLPAEAPDGDIIIVCKSVSVYVWIYERRKHGRW
jgi:hypothetical protein